MKLLLLAVTLLFLSWPAPAIADLVDTFYGHAGITIGIVPPATFSACCLMAALALNCRPEAITVIYC